MQWGKNIPLALRHQCVYDSKLRHSRVQCQDNTLKMPQLAEHLFTLSMKLKRMP